MVRFTALSLVFSALAFAGAASAGDWKSDSQRQTVEEPMSIKKVDFSNPGQVKVLYRKLKFAAARVCASDKPQEPGVAEADAACAADVLTSTVARINQPQLTQYAAQVNGSANRLALNVR